jgi:N-carbamoylputrescine amidase
MILMPHSAPSPTPSRLVRREVFDAYTEVLREVPLHYARLLGVPVVYVNKSGRFRSPTPGLPFYRQDSFFPGESAIVDSDGTVRGRMGMEEGVLVADVTLDPARKTGVVPECRGRWAMKVPREINMFRVAEAMGRAWYGLSGERRKRAREVQELRLDEPDQA